MKFRVIAEDENDDQYIAKYIIRCLRVALDEGFPKCAATFEALTAASEISFRNHPRPLFKDFDLVELAAGPVRSAIGSGPGMVIIPHDDYMPRPTTNYRYQVLWLYGAMRDRAQLLRQNNWYACAANLIMRPIFRKIG